MSIFFPYSSTEVINTLSSWFSLDLSSLSSFEISLLTIVSNLYFFIFWGFIIYLVLKSIIWVYERLF